MTIPYTKSGDRHTLRVDRSCINVQHHGRHVSQVTMVCPAGVMDEAESTISCSLTILTVRIRALLSEITHCTRQHASVLILQLGLAQAKQLLNACSLSLSLSLSFSMATKA